VKIKTNRIILLTLTFLLGSIVAFAQGPNVTGTYEGMVKIPNGPEQKLSLELKSEGTKVTGHAKHGDKTIAITDGKFENGTLTLVFDSKDHTFVGKVDGDTIKGEAGDGAQKIPLELKKVTPAAEATPAAAAAPAGALNLSGQWDAVADANGQPFPFLLTLKVEGETVTGSSSSQLGEAAVKGTWKDGKLVFQAEGQNGTISMSATVIDGKLSGEYDYAGQLQGKWVAVRKN
jgi:cytolysin (calcineurin-like family phosphatase)